ncbi:MAG: hypothetical protein PVH68_20450 [Armatimonadota bacterium]|jgi:hypothetical protein
MLRRKRIKPGDTVPLRLTARQHRLFVDEVLLYSDLDDQLRLGTADEDGVVLHLTLQDADELAGSVAFAANHTEDRKLQRELDAIYSRVAALLDGYTDQDEDTEAHPDPLGIGAGTTDAEGLVDPLMGLELKGAILDVTRQMQSELGGLSLPQAHALCLSNWDEPTGALRLNEELSLADVQAAPMLVNARLFLHAVMDAGRVKATVAGNLTRRFVGSMLDRLRCEPGYVDSVRAVNKVINEEDFWPLHIVRVLLELSRLVRRAKGWFMVVKKRQGMLADEMAGALYALMFRTHFRKFNLAYLDRLPQINSLQGTIAFSLYMVGRHTDTWIDSEELAPLVLFPVARDEVENLRPGKLTPWPVESRILRPLVSFGLLERRRVASEHPWMEPCVVRKTELFDRFLQFNLEEGPGPIGLAGLHPPGRA